MTPGEFAWLLLEGLAYGVPVSLAMALIFYHLEGIGDSAALSGLLAALATLIIVAIAVFVSVFV